MLYQLLPLFLANRWLPRIKENPNIVIIDYSFFVECLNAISEDNLNTSTIYENDEA